MKSIGDLYKNSGRAPRARKLLANRSDVDQSIDFDQKKAHKASLKRRAFQAL